MASFEVEVAAPFRLDLAVWALRWRAHNQMDRFDGGCWRRVLATAGRTVEIAVTQPARPDRPRLAVEATARRPGRGGDYENELRGVVGRCLGLDVNLEGFYRLAERDWCLAGLAGRFHGMRPPRFLTVFEAVVNAIACQQLSLTEQRNSR
ncbi:MAG: hypothetical protein ACRDQH_13760 [Pseudonocardiaceae bacterium]